VSLEPLVDAFVQAVHLIVRGDPELVDITLRSFQVSFYALLMAGIVGVPLSALIGLRRFPGRRLVKTVFSTLIGVPTVALGLVLYLVLSRSGPLGSLQLLYTVQGMSLGQALLVLPVVVSFGVSAIEAQDARLRDLARTLGASELETALTILQEASNGIVLALVAAFNRAFAELGIAMMLGANIRNLTRVLTTTIALQSTMGQIRLSIALSIVLVAVVFTLNGLVSLLSARPRLSLLRRARRTT
jgi:tungstate transport system permease protein